MKVLRVGFVLLISACSREGHTVTQIPGDWMVVQPPLPESDGARCANWAPEIWSVAVAADNDELLVRPFEAERYADTVVLKDGRLIANDQGEFGGEV